MSPAVQVTIITPERTVLETHNAQHVLLPAENGELGILPGHVAMVCTLQVGRIRVDLPSRPVELATSGGFAEVLGDAVTITVETAERAGEIDTARALRARDRAEELLLGHREETDHAAAQTSLRRSLNRLAVADEG